MCCTVVISSQKPLPVLPWDEDNPGFCLLQIKDEGMLDMIQKVVSGRYYYAALSHMGCSCGLGYFEDYKTDPQEDYEQRVKDVKDLAAYIDEHKVNNEMLLFSSDWTEFPEVYPIRDFSTAEMGGSEFNIDELTILRIV